MPIVVTATSGNLGRLVVKDLLNRGVPAAEIVATARSAGAIKDLADAGVRTAVIDYDGPGTVEAALSDGDTFVLISGNDLANRDRQHADAIAAAKRAGVGHLVYTSGLRAATGSPSAIAASHAVTEAAVRDSGIPFTLLRNGWYTENYGRNLPAARTTGLLLASVGDARSPPPGQDFAQAVGAVVTTGGRLGKTYELSGDVAWNYNDLAAAFSKLPGAPSSTSL